MSEPGLKEVDEFLELRGMFCQSETWFLIGGFQSRFVETETSGGGEFIIAGKTETGGDSIGKRFN